MPCGLEAVAWRLGVDGSGAGTDGSRIGVDCSSVGADGSGVGVDGPDAGTVASITGAGIRTSDAGTSTSGAGTSSIDAGTSTTGAGTSTTNADAAVPTPPQNESANPSGTPAGVFKVSTPGFGTPASRFRAWNRFLNNRRPGPQPPRGCSKHRRWGSELRRRCFLGRHRRQNSSSRLILGRRRCSKSRRRDFGRGSGGCGMRAGRVGIGRRRDRVAGGVAAAGHAGW